MLDFYRFRVETIKFLHSKGQTSKLEQRPSTYKKLPKISVNCP